MKRATRHLCLLQLRLHHCISLAGGLSQSSKTARPRSAFWSTAKPQQMTKAAGRAPQPQQGRRSVAKRQKKPVWKPEQEWDSSPLTLLERQEQLKRNTLDTHRSHRHQKRLPNTFRSALHLHAAYQGLAGRSAFEIVQPLSFTI